MILPTSSHAADVPAPLISQNLDHGPIKLMINKSLVIQTSRPYKRVSTAQSEIADVNPVGAMSILVTGKKAGTTQMIVWDDADQSQTLDVLVEVDIQTLQQQMKTLFPAAKIDVASANGAVVLRGRVPSLNTAEQAAQTASPYANRVLNFLEVSGGQQIMLQVRFAEVSRAATTSLGVNFGVADGQSFIASNVGQINPFSIHQFGNEATGLGVPLPANPSVTQFGRIAVGQSTIDYFINALRSNNLLRILAEPNLVATSGEEASFLAGGEFPIPITQSGAGTGGTPAITVEYREFGVRLTFVPVVLGSGRIRLKVSPEVSDLDFSTAVRFGGWIVPGLTSRKVQTTIELAEGQTFAIAGLLNSSVAANKDVTPVLGDVPVLGALFRSVRYQRKETELVVLVTPRLVDAMNPGQTPSSPGENWRHPSEPDLFLKADIGSPIRTGPRPTTSPATTAAQPPPFYGQYGFQPVTSAPTQAQ
ncbi:MAG: type II and III secretion system protein family protein [Bacillota bacterium]